MKENMFLELKRLRKSVSHDKNLCVNHLSKIVGAEVLNLLENYFVLREDSFQLGFEIGECGEQIVKIVAEIKRAKPVGFLPDENGYI